MLHFVKLNSCQIQIIKQTPNILLAKISAYAVEHTKLLLVANEVCLCGLVSTYCERCEFIQRHVAGELVVAARTILGLFPMMCVIRSYLPCVSGRTIYQFVCSSGHSSYWFHIPFPNIILCLHVAIILLLYRHLLQSILYFVHVCFVWNKVLISVLGFESCL